MNPDTRIAVKLLAVAAALAIVGAAGLAIGYRTGSARAFLRDRRLAESPEAAPGEAAEWSGETPETPPPPVLPPQPPGPPVPPEGEEVERPEDLHPLAAAGPDAPLAMDVTRPVRITWPLEIGPDWCRDRPDERVCLRAREGANELQTPGAGRALYPFRVAEAGKYRAWCRVRWTDDGTGSLDCNNSWFAAFDDRPAAVVGNEGWENSWHWEAGPAADLSAGVHWLRIELREDGPCMDRAVVAAAGKNPAAGRFDDLSPPEAALAGEFAGGAPPLEPHRPVGVFEFWAHPTGSLVIGKGHANEITVGGWSQESLYGGNFSGRIEVRCPTAPGLTISGDARITCAPFTRKVLRLSFPPDTARREHKVIIRVLDTGGRAVFRGEIRMVRPWAWAFLGPFADTAATAGGVYRGTGSIRGLRHPCDKDPTLLARMRPPEELGLAGLAGAGGRAPAWKVVSDGSCCSWTGAVDLHRVFGRTGPAFAYAATWIDAQTSLHHRSFTFQADDSAWLWMNGDFVVALPVDLPKEANRLWTSARLRPGPNPVAVKITQNRRYWGFRLEVVDWHWQGKRGDVITGVDPARWPK